MSGSQLTDIERMYLECEVPMRSGGRAVSGMIGGFFLSLLSAAFSPGYGKADSKLMRTSREIRYTKYKKTVLKKLDGTLTPRDEKTLKKLNKAGFILDFDTYDPDKFTEQLYEEYMDKHKDENS